MDFHLPYQSCCRGWANTQHSYISFQKKVLRLINQLSDDPAVAVCYCRTGTEIHIRKVIFFDRCKTASTTKVFYCNTHKKLKFVCGIKLMSYKYKYLFKNIIECFTKFEKPIILIPLQMPDFTYIRYTLLMFPVHLQ